MISKKYPLLHSSPSKDTALYKNLYVLKHLFEKKTRSSLHAACLVEFPDIHPEKDSSEEGKLRHGAPGVKLPNPEKEKYIRGLSFCIALSYSVCGDSPFVAWQLLPELGVLPPRRDAGITSLCLGRLSLRWMSGT
jgi:hypothetical protein